jgi:hypothetical protein
MRAGVFRRDTTCGRLLRPLIGIAVAYTIAVQSLLIALGGFSLHTYAAEGPVASELCLHDSKGASELPADNTDHAGCTYCIFCFAGSHHAVVSAAPVFFTRAYIEVTGVPWAADRRPIPRLRAYSIASPRGPPLHA